MSIEETERQIIKEFQQFDGDYWMVKYEHLIKIGKSLPNINPQHKTDSNLIKGCQSKVWLTSKGVGNNIVFSADSDTIITKGMVALLIRVLSNRTANEIINAKLNFIDTIGLTKHLTPSRSNGLLSMIKQMKIEAAAYK